MRVNVDFFKPSGKWYISEEVFWFYSGTSESPVPASFVDVMARHTYFGNRLTGMTAVCTGRNPLGFPQLCVVP